MPFAQERQVGLREIWQVVAKRKWLLLIPFMIIIGVSYGGSFLLSSRYQSSAVMLTTRSQIVTRDIQRMLPGEYEPPLSTDRQFARMVNETRGQITSGTNLVKLIDQLGLAKDPRVLKKAAEMQKSYPGFSREDLAYRVLIDELRAKIAIDFISENLLKLTVENESPLAARDQAQKLAEIYREEKLRADLLSVRSQLEFSNSQAQIYKKELMDKEDQLATYRHNYQMSSMDRSLTTQDNIKDIEAEIDRTRLVDLVETRDNLKFLETQLTGLGTRPETIRIPSDLDFSKRVLLDRTSQLAELMEKYTWRDAKVNSQKRLLEAMLDTLQAQTDTAVASEYKSLPPATQAAIGKYVFAQIELEYLDHKETSLRDSKERIKQSFTSGPVADVQLSNLEKEVDRAKDLYDKFYESYTGSQLAMEIYREDAENRYRIIEPAAVALAPSWPDRIKLTLMGCALGLLLGVGAVILAEVTDHSFKSVENVETQLGLKVLGTIPRIDFKPVAIKFQSAPKKMVGSKT